MRKIISPLSGKEELLSSVLYAMCGQENCDGEPYDQMQAAADYIRALEDVVQTAHDLTITRHGAIDKIEMIHKLCDRVLEHKQ
jgi:hypothetical protein